MNQTRATLLVLLLAIAAIGSACSGSTVDVIATVNGSEIALEDVTALRSTYQRGDRIPNNEQFRTEVSTLIIERAAEQRAAEDFGVFITDADVEAKLAALAPAETDLLLRQHQAEGNADLTAAFDRLLARNFLLRDLVIDAIASDPSMHADVLANQVGLVTTVCPRHLLVGTEAEATEAYDRIDGGEEFADVADEISTDPTPGGVLPCPSPALASPSVAFNQATLDAPLGELYGPFESEFGWHVLIVDSRTTATAEEIAADPQGTIAPSHIGQLFNEWFSSVLDGAQIDVNERIGTWVPEAFGIRPPGE